MHSKDHERALAARESDSARKIMTNRPKKHERQRSFRSRKFGSTEKHRQATNNADTALYDKTDRELDTAQLPMAQLSSRFAKAERSSALALNNDENVRTSEYSSKAQCLLPYLRTSLSNRLLFDSGASDHTINEKSWLRD